ncbi:AzlD domain-containing protein [Streptomyces sp. NPDC001700]
MAAAASGAVNWALRALPFAALTSLRASKTVLCLGARMPARVMAILFVCCLRDLPLTEAHAAVLLAAVAVTVGLHLWRRRPAVGPPTHLRPGPSDGTCRGDARPEQRQIPTIDKQPWGFGMCPRGDLNPHAR